MNTNNESNAAPAPAAGSDAERLDALLDDFADAIAAREGPNAAERRRAITEARECRAAIVAHFAASAPPQPAQAEVWIVALQHEWKQPGQPTQLANLLPDTFGRQTFASFDEASAFIASHDLPLGWVAVKLEAAQPSPPAQGDGDGLAILKRLVANWTRSAKDCRDMAERIGPNGLNGSVYNELHRDGAQYDQSIYGVGLAIAALQRGTAGDAPGDEAAFDDAAVDAFATAMKAKLAAARAKGRGGWQDKAQCTQQQLSDMLRDHVVKGDPRDVANFCMMLHQRGEAIARPEPLEYHVRAIKGLQRWHANVIAHASKDADELALAVGQTLQSLEGILEMAMLFGPDQEEWGNQPTARTAQPDLVPGVVRCAKCAFQLQRTNLYMGDGTTGPGSSETEPCPNGCGPLWPVTWKQWAEEGWKTAGRFFEESRTAQRGVTLRAWTEEDGLIACEAWREARGKGDDMPLTWMLAALNAVSPHGCPVVTRGEGEGA